VATPPFADRIDAGQKLAERLRHYANRDDVIVLGLPRGGVPVANEVAHALNAPLDIILVRKLGVPGHEELAMGAIATGGTIIINSEVLDALPGVERFLESVAAREKLELRRREEAYRGNRAPPEIKGKTVILIDDGLATGASMRAAVQALRAQRAGHIVVAVPVAPPETCETIRHEVDEVICLLTPEPFHAVSLWYRDMSQTTDEEVKSLLENSSAMSQSGSKT
jgi:predicted phosphoribosyltransferase